MRTLRQLVLVAAGLMLLSAAPARADVLKIVVDDMIHPITDEFIGRAIEEARQNKYDAILIQLRTPGGLSESTRDIVEKMLASPVPIIVYVAPSGARAASAGFFILQAADVAAMAPGTNTGAATPVFLGGGGGGGSDDDKRSDKNTDTLMKKAANDSAAFMRAYVAKRGRNVAVAESAVLEAKSFTEEEALKQNLIEFVAKDEQDLFAQMKGKPVKRFDGTNVQLDLVGKTVHIKEMTVRQRLLAFIMDPNVAFILFSIGMLALYAEFNNPGAVLPGVVGLICIMLAVFALNILPTRYAALALIVAAFVLFALEAAYTSHGVLGGGGVIAMVIGALLLVDGPIPEMRVRWYTALAVTIPFAFITIFLMTLVIRARRRKSVSGEQGLMGEVGVARTPLSPQGKVFIHGELWDAVADAAVDAGDRVAVNKVDGLLLYVRRLD
jgi:membrane-bound serine protease (ClpP class)